MPETVDEECGLKEIKRIQRPATAPDTHATEYFTFEQMKEILVVTLHSSSRRLKRRPKA